MTVRWKPLLILSGLFVVVALMGLMTIATVMGSKSSSDFVARARKERQAGQFEKAQLDYQIALKKEGRNASLHEEMAELYEDWAAKAPVEKKAELRGLRLASLANSAKNGTKRVEPRRKLLAEAIRGDDTLEQVRWSKDIAALDPRNGDAHYVLAAEELEATSPDLAEVRRHLEVLDAETPRRARADWVAAKLAKVGKDQTKMEQALARGRAVSLPADAGSIDRMAMLRLRALDVKETADPAELAGKVEALAREALAASAEPEIPSTRIARISLLIEDVQRGLVRLAVEKPASRERLDGFGNTLDGAAEAIFQKSLAAKGGADLNVYLAYADHLRFRDRRDRCFAVVQQGLASPAGAKQAATEAAMGLHALAVEACLASFADKGRYDAAAPHIKALLEGKFEPFQALAHLFQGAIDLEKAGMVADAQAVEIPKVEQIKLRATALGHLRIAATQLPHLGEAQARYGIALILNQELAMGRQHLQKAQRIAEENRGVGLEPQYQIWAAWSVVQAGYPEDAEPIVARMLRGVKEGKLPASLEGTLHLLSGEIHQSRKTPAELKKAIEEYRLAFANGQDATPAVELRLAQIEVQLGRSADALKRVNWLSERGKAGPAAENLAVLTLLDLKRDADARKRLDEARARYPESGDLAALDSSIYVKANQFEQADRVLADFLARTPDDMAAVQQRAQLLAESLGRPLEARALLSAVADRAENSAPLVQLALLELQAKDYAAVAATIAKVRQRWKDAATGDLLDAQVALAREDRKAAAAHFDAALLKDPNNKVVQFYKAQLAGRSDPETASKIYQTLAREQSSKELDAGLSLTTASQSALAGIALESGDLDTAIARYREMLKDGASAPIARAIRWQLVAAMAAKKEWPAARAEITGPNLLGDPRTAPTPEERVRAATYFRLNKEDDAALALVDAVLKADPAHPGAVVTKAEILARRKQQPEATATLKAAIAASTAAGKKAPAVLYLMMAAVESTVLPTDQGFAKALVVLEDGLKETPDAVELIQAKARVLTLTKGPAAGSAYMEDLAKADPKGPYRRMLMATYRDNGDLASAERVAAEMAKDDPGDAGLAAVRVQLVAAQAIDAGRKGDRDGRKKLDEKTAALIYEDRAKFKADPAFTQLDCELEIRRGDTTRALALTQEIDAQAKNSPVGPLLRAQVFSSKNQTREAAAAFAEALAREPRLPEARLQLARLSLRNGQVDEAIRQARFLQDADPDKPTAQAALLVEARGLAIQAGTAAQVQANRDRALDRLAAAIKAKPEFAEARYLTAEIRLMSNDRPRAVAALKSAIAANPDDTIALSLAVQALTEPRPKGQPAASKAEIDEARAIAEASGKDDTKGDRWLAIGNGFAKAGQAELALPWSEKAAAKLDNPPARLALGDLLLTMSEAQSDRDRSEKLQTRALAEYDAVLAARPNTVDAVNNKAWILHSYRGQSQAALELAQGLLQRVDPALLPGEFYDTLGSIQEGLGNRPAAEESYKKGLGKSPAHPVLNYHMGQLMLGDKAKAAKAADYLKVAEAGRDRLPADMAGKLNSLLQQVRE